MPRKTMGRGSSFRTRIDVSDQDAVRYWCRQLAVTPIELRYLVASVGPSLEELKMQLMSIAMAPSFARAKRSRNSGA